MLFAVDMGGTKTTCALFDYHDNGFVIRYTKKYTSKDISSFEELIMDFLQSQGLWQSNEIESAWFGIAGPCSKNTCSLSNLNLSIDMKSLRKALAFVPYVGWGNDLVALGHGIAYLPQDSLCLLSGGTFQNENNSISNKAILAPGTGLGESIIMDSHVYPTEGGHTDFAPTSEEDLGLWLYLHDSYGHVSYERILSGPGLVNVYHYLAGQAKYSPYAHLSPSPEKISEAALAKTCPLSMKALDTFVRILGAEAGNLALKNLALGGVYLGGGIPPKIIEKLMDGTFQKSFSAKGRFSKILEGIPVYLILDENTPLLGGAALALKQLKL
ncbi:MAG: glucokinase [Peptostreptococcales bacterium]